jgi:hypothetical protein
MKKVSQTIPNGQKDIIRYALEKRAQQLREDIKKYKGSDIEAMNYELFDITVLLALFDYEIEVTMSINEHDNFTQKNGVDFPLYD